MPTTRRRRHFRFVLDSLAATRAFTSATLRHEGGRRGRRRDPSLKASAKETILRAEWYRRGGQGRRLRPHLYARPRALSRTRTRADPVVSLNWLFPPWKRRKGGRRADGGRGHERGRKNWRSHRPSWGNPSHRNQAALLSTVRGNFELEPAKANSRRIATITRRSPMEARKRPAWPKKRIKLMHHINDQTLSLSLFLSLSLSSLGARTACGAEEEGGGRDTALSRRRFLQLAALLAGSVFIGIRAELFPPPSNRWWHGRAEKASRGGSNERGNMQKRHGYPEGAVCPSRSWRPYITSAPRQNTRHR